uniref:PX domain-containing protein n=1 Tax=Gadus morhua TaxID=8049 RepID=A0A8C5C2D5_GADMO
MEEEEAEESPPLSPSVIEGTEEVTPPLSVSPSTIRVTEAAQDGELLTFIIVSQKLSGTGEYHVDRTYEDFDWLQQHLFSLEDVPGIQGIISWITVVFSPTVGLLATGETWTPYCRALGAYLQQVAGHSLLSRTQHLETFLTSPEVEEEEEEALDLYKNIRYKSIESSAEPNVYTNIHILLHVLHVCLSVTVCLIAFILLTYSSVTSPKSSCFGLTLCEQEMLFRRTCKLVELETASRNAERAKPLKKAAVNQKAAEKDFEQVSVVAKQEVQRRASRSALSDSF